MPLLRKLEEVLVQLVRVVLLAFAILILVAIASYVWDKSVGKKKDDTSSSVVWSDVQPDLKYVVEETGRDLGLSVPDVAFQDSLSDPALRPFFKQADTLVRNFVAAKAEHHQQIEKNNDEQGLAPLNPLLIGDSVPTKAQIEAFAKELAEKEKADAEKMARLLSDDSDSEAEAQATAAAVDACCGSSESMIWTNPVDVPRALYDRAVQARSQYNEQAYAAFVKGAPPSDGAGAERSDTGPQTA